jgi:hypothetical protein
VSSDDRAEVSTTAEASLADHTPTIDKTEQARERLFADFYFELNQIPEEPHPKH